MQSFLHGAALLLFGFACTWGLSMFLGRLVSRRAVTFWVWNRSGSIGRLLILGGLCSAVLGLNNGGTEVGISFLLLGSLACMAGVWLVSAV